MTAFPRTIIPFEVSSLEMPGPLISKAQSGRVNIRSTQQIGRTWTEHYLINVRSVAGRGLLAAVDNFYRNGTIFTIDHRDHLTPMGAGGGSPLINLPTQLISDPENFGAWTPVSAPTLTSGQSDPLGGTAAYNLSESDAAGQRFITHAVTFTGSAVKAIALDVRKGAVSPATGARINIQDTTAVADRLFSLLTWSGTTPVLATSTGTFLGKEDLGSGWWRLLFQSTSVTAANSHLYRIMPASVGAEIGDLYIFGANAWDVSTPGPYSGPSQVVTTGSNLYVDGATVSITNWLRAGDILQVGGLAAVYEATADVTTTANGLAIIPINPPIFSGGSPADNAVVTITGVTMNACILEPPSYPSTSGIGADWGEVICKFSESL